MNICIANTVVEFDPSEKTFNENLYIGREVLIIGDPLLTRLQCFSIQLLILQYNHRTPAAQIIWITIISIKG